MEEPTKTIATLLTIFTIGTGAFAQGTVTFNNNPATLISTGAPGSALAMGAGAPGSYYFALLTSLTGAPGSFLFSGVYGTNNVAAGRFTGGTATLAGIAPGTTFSFEVAGWSANLGATFDPNWLAGAIPWYGNFGLSGIATAAAGGGTPPAPPGIIFGATGLTSGFIIYSSPSFGPEPSTMALAGLGACVLLIRRRRQ
jgi:hypothetical protein